MDTKLCSCCKSVKNVDDFYKDKRKKDGCYSKCKSCFSEYQKRKLLGNYSRMSEYIKRQIISLYESGMGTHKISKEVGYSKSSILKFLKSINIIRKSAKYRKYKFINENYFDVIDNVEKAYFLGLLWADGCNYINENSKAYQIIISLQERDGYIIRDLANKIFENDEIVKTVNKKSDNDYTRQSQLNLRIPSKHISTTLLNYGMIPRKSSTLKMPVNIEWSEDLHRGFIRGFFDGDGSIYFNTNSKNYSISLISGIEHIKELNDIIYQYTKKRMSYFELDRYSTPMANLKLHGNIVSKNFLDWLYKDSTIHLSRKFEKYQKLKCMVDNSLT